MPPVIAAIGPIIAGISSAGAAIAGGATALAEGIGIPAMIAGPLGTGVEMALGEGALGAATSAIEGQNPLKGLESGAISGFLGGAGGPLLQGFGLAAPMATGLANAAGGALGGFATGGSPITGAIEGFGSGLIGSSLLKGTGAPTGGVGGAGGAAPAGVSLDPSTSGLIGAAGDQLGLFGPTNASTAGFATDAGGAMSGAPVSATTAGTVGAGASAGAAGSLPGDISMSGVSGVPGSILDSGTLNSALGSTPGLNVAGGAGGAPAAAGTAPGAAQGGGFLGDLGKNPAALLAGAGLLGDVIKGNQMYPAEKQLQTSANQLAAEGQLNEGYLRSGTLPPGEQALLNAQGESAKAAINSMYAGRGMQGSSANVTDIANEGFRQLGTGAELAMQLFQTGVQQTEMSDNILAQLLNVQMGTDNELSNAIAKMAGSLAGMGAPIPTGA